MTYILIYTFIYLFFAVVAVLSSQKLGLGSVLGYLMAGIVIGPTLGLVGKEAESIQHIAEFGVVMMLFLVGLELAPQMLWQMRHKLLGLGGLQVLGSVGAIAAVAMAFGQTWQISVAIACILALSSTAIVLQTFAEKQLLQTEGGQAGFAVLLFQDVAAIPMLALLPLLAVGGHQAASADAHSSNILAGQAGWVVALVSVAAIALILFAVRYLVPFVFRFIAKTRLREMFTVFTLTLVVGIAALMSLIGLSPALGAFIAGVALANSSYRHEMESNLEPFKSLFLGLFFITVGASMNFGLLGSHFVEIVAITAGVMLIKAVVLWILGKGFRLSALSSKLFALSLAQAGEFGFVLLSIANQSHVLPKDIHDKTSLVVALSMLLTPLLFIFYDKVLAKRAIIAENENRPDDEIHEENPVVLLGHGRFGQQINRMLIACGFHVTVIDNHAEMVEGLTKYGIKTYYGDATRPELLSAAGLHQAKLLIVCVGDNHDSTEIVAYARHNYPHLIIIARAHDRLHAFDLKHAGASYIIRETADSAMRSGRIALECLGLSSEKAREAAKFYEARDRYQLEQASNVYRAGQSFFDNQEMMDLARTTDEETHQLMMKLLRGETVEWQENPDSWTRRQKGIS
ncbi:monovalent cation:proton antiporter-2 (CPA2) family protein [Alysiella filiformis]|uniref:Kef-type potassium/proton antiporter, CPA2 family (TC 2.A.37.1) n=1 Tax=Alysiella filiformis DSM 16848 TaxID=1120981 RepID=A0A286EBM8_9NEIS|nr:monovalent cation:proton antiporter-2 (CPA2) family protein [Alysiella filiformis]QMT31286.1 cation:proton antiporter [Alysiella filiformis]UBQ55710.1 monovalent cation:proton antiporter-2 (CPA2) family protein [Alysiella filiformis DSM 16848]SOD68280.1 Kef-type potassium/proton antiporter, CPA2 family (TC 2.A.37.1) [Alysiella filiformis DSM 16848]